MGKIQQLVLFSDRVKFRNKAGHTHLSAGSVSGINDLLVNSPATYGNDACLFVDLHMVDLFHIDQDAVLHLLQLWCVSMTSILS